VLQRAPTEVLSGALTDGPSGKIPLSVNVVAELRNRLREVGWAELDSACAGDVLDLAWQLGRPGPSRPGGEMVDHLIPLARSQAHLRSMSAVFGKGAFPFHTDLAHFSDPPRFVLIRAERVDGIARQTLLQDFRSLELTQTTRQLLAHGPFFIRGGHRPFLCAIADRVPGSAEEIVRYDGCCMTPASSSARRAELALTQKMSEAEPVRIEWYRGRTIVIDNWRVLHARAATPLGSDSEARVLERVLVWASKRRS